MAVRLIAPPHHDEFEITREAERGDITYEEAVERVRELHGGGHPQTVPEKEVHKTSKTVKGDEHNGYNTPLSKEELSAYAYWRQHNQIHATNDYDWQGYWKSKGQYEDSVQYDMEEFRNPNHKHFT